MNHKEELLSKFNESQGNYQEKRSCMDDWKEDFKKLETEIQNLIASFHKHYESSELTEDFSSDIRGKLENRREGIRLSVKSASRLLKKLAPEKPLTDVEKEFIANEKLAKEILAAREFSPIKEAAEEQNEFVQGEIENEISAAISETGAINKENTVSQKKQNEKNSVVEEVSEGNKSDLTIIQDAIQINDGILIELKEHLQSAENRFFKFIEKGVAPVLDGLYSGKAYALDLIEQLEKNNNEELNQTKQWLTIYDTLMNEIEELFARFSIKLYAPERGSFFDENKQEPIGVIEAADLEDEQIKEVVRYGLHFEKEMTNESSYLLRPAQVIVVKNKKVEVKESCEGNEQ
ncbi:nucleotide exchange factor GrpE [Niallia nealsonii]|uniref:Nucleotide exchange factor GrpE n=1 Tax=Niallia nealsonii TaxID=115979 RepID=A0A2N0Z065_9BACI|nr:nucleotide exchange factor GrpE [Niallia nealsonii]PKG22903.1 nucleotide exchange factor GrpE [Niallia nealsonii]